MFTVIEILTPFETANMLLKNSPFVNLSRGNFGKSFVSNYLLVKMYRKFPKRVLKIFFGKFTAMS